MGCAACHRLDGYGGGIGPELSNISRKFSVRSLLEAIIEPNKEISSEYGLSIIALNDGTTLEGTIANQNASPANGEDLVFTDEAPSPLRVAGSAIKSITPSPVSKMPEGLINALNKAELADLLAYLLSNGNPQDARYYAPPRSRAARL